jgi:hypothetical protein
VALSANAALCSEACGEQTCYVTSAGSAGPYTSCPMDEICTADGVACACTVDASCNTASTTSTTLKATTTTVSGPATTTTVRGPTTTYSTIPPEKAIQKRVNEVVCTLFKLVLMVSGAIAALMIMFAGMRYMRAEDDPAKADNAKKMIGYALTGLILVFIACPVVDFLVTNTKIVPFEQSCKCFASGGGGGGGATTTIGSGTTTTTTGGGTTTTSAIPPAKQLTAGNLAACINSKGVFYTDEICKFCIFQKNLFYAEVGADVGDGKNVYNTVLAKAPNPLASPCGGGGLLPCWTYPAKGKTEGGCKTFPQLRTIYECDLIEVPGHSYYTICS